MPSKQKLEKVKEYQELLSDIKSIVVLDYRGLSVADANALRAKAREANVLYRVVKNNLIKRVLNEDKELVKLCDEFVETRSIAVSKDDEIAPIKVISEFAKKNDNIKIICGYFDGDVLDVQAIDALAKLPSREELIAQIAAGIQAPTQYLATGINTVMQKLAIAVNAMKDKIEDEQNSA